jgi:hypothetical protein
MNFGKFEKYKSWMISAGIAGGIAIWLLPSVSSVGSVLIEGN